MPQHRVNPNTPCYSNYMTMEINKSKPGVRLAYVLKIISILCSLFEERISAQFCCGRPKSRSAQGRGDRTVGGRGVCARACGWVVGGWVGGSYRKKNVALREMCSQV